MHVLKGSTLSPAPQSPAAQPAQAGPDLEEKEASKPLDFVVTGKGNLYSGKKPMVWIPDTGERVLYSSGSDFSRRTGINKNTKKGNPWLKSVHKVGTTREGEIKGVSGKLIYISNQQFKELRS